MATDVIEAFSQSPSEELLEGMTKEQLLELAAHYKIELTYNQKRSKDGIKLVIENALCDLKILRRKSRVPDLAALPDLSTLGATALSPSARAELTALSMPIPTTLTLPELSTLSFEQQKELLMLQRDTECEKRRLECDKVRLEIERRRLDLHEGKPVGADFDIGSTKLSVAHNLHLVPPFNESEVEIFFLLFERVAVACKWSNVERAMLLQCVLTGKAQQAYSTLSDADSQNYEAIKAAVLKINERVPESYRQHFRTLQRKLNETNVEFVRGLTVQFDRWCSAADSTTMDKLRELILFEQYRNTLPEIVATYVAERQVKTASEAALLVDDWELIHEPYVERFSERQVHTRVNSSVVPVGPARRCLEKTSSDYDNCNYCLGKGHWKSNCPVLKSKNSTVKFSS